MLKLAGLAASTLGSDETLGVLKLAMRAALASAGARLLEAVVAGEDGYWPRAKSGGQAAAWPVNRIAGHAASGRRIRRP